MLYLFKFIKNKGGVPMSLTCFVLLPGSVISLLWIKTIEVVYPLDMNVFYDLMLPDGVICLLWIITYFRHMLIFLKTLTGIHL